MLESNIERLRQGLRDVQCACPHGGSRSCPWNQPLDRHPRSMIRHGQERRVTFWDLEVELDPEEGTYRGVLGHFSRIFPEDSGRVPLSAQRQEAAHPPGRSMACQDAEGRGELPIRAFHPGCLNLDGLVGPPNGYAILARRTHHHPRGGGPKETCSENLHIFFNSSS